FNNHGCVFSFSGRKTLAPAPPLRHFLKHALRLRHETKPAQHQTRQGNGEGYVFYFWRTGY
ncbi:hypothetical protein, partial [Klebsiella pneumoniae]